jgi:hypothetical protein
VFERHAPFQYGLEMIACLFYQARRRELIKNLLTATPFSGAIPDSLTSLSGSQPLLNRNHAVEKCSTTDEQVCGLIELFRLE